MRISKLALNIIELSVALLILLTALPTSAIVDDLDEEEPSATTAGASSVTSTRYEYLGSRDEQLLEVQASLPTPSRSYDGSVSIRLPSDDADSSHD